MGASLRGVWRPVCMCVCRWAAAGILGMLAACGLLSPAWPPPAPSTPPAPPPVAAEAAPAVPVPPEPVAVAAVPAPAAASAPVAAPTASPAVPPTPAPAAAPPADAEVLTTARGRWVAVDWSALPGWDGDAVIHAWPALLRSCERIAPEAVATWAGLCDAARALAAPDETRVRAFLRERLRPWRVEAQDGQQEGLITGYFEPVVEASRKRTARFAVPLHAPPADLATRVPWYARAQIDTLPAARAALHGREIAWVQNPLDALLLQIQGSGRLRFREGGSQQVVRLAYAAHNHQPYQSIGRWLVEQKAFTLEQASWPAIRDWARANPTRVKEMLQANPRYIFFREEPLPDPTVGPLGAQGVPLTPGRSIAVDKDSIPYGTPVWIATTEPVAWVPPAAGVVLPPPRLLQRLVVAQDTGSAITGAVRADYFWGWSQGADLMAGRMKQPLRMWVLWPALGPRGR